MASLCSAAPWTTPAGANGSLTYSNGQDLNAHFADPNVGDEKFAFPNPTAFVAVSPGSPTTVTDTVSFNVVASPGQTIDTVSARIEGDYSFLGDPAQIDYSAVLSINGGTYAVPLVFAPPSPQTGGEGEFVGTVLIDLIPDLSNASVALTATLTASSSGSATTTLQIKNAEIAFTTIPEPASLGLIGGVASMLLRRRR
jgi:hypothetical protein